MKVAVSGQVVDVQGPKGKDKMTVHAKVKAAFVEAEKAVKVTVAPGFENDADANAQWGTTAP